MQQGEASPHLWWLTSLPEHVWVGFPVYALRLTDKTQQLLFSQESEVLGMDISVAQSAAVTGEARRGAAGLTPGARSCGRAQTGPAGCQ